MTYPPPDPDTALTFDEAEAASVDGTLRDVTGNTRLEWVDASTATYTAESTVVNGHLVCVCLDDEGPLRPAFYWDIDDRAIDGWASTPGQARREAVKAARALPPRPNIWEDFS